MVKQEVFGERQVAAARSAPERVAAYHGCHADAAARLLAGERFRRSTNDYDWLGSGIYFWEYAPHRALEWARRRFGDEGVVIEANVTLKHCLNLLDSIYFTSLQTTYTKIATAMGLEGATLPVNKKRGRHELDRLVIDTFCDDYIQDIGVDFATIRGCFPEGEPVYDGIEDTTIHARGDRRARSGLHFRSKVGTISVRTHGRLTITHRKSDCTTI